MKQKKAMMRAGACLLGLLPAISTLPAPVHAAAGGAASWDATHVSPAINRGDTDVVVEYAPARDAFGRQPASTISRVHAGVSYQSSAIVLTRLCWNGTARCVPVIGQTINTNAFNGLSADKPMFLVHTARGKGPLPSPVFVQGNVIVWFSPTPP